ncbi:MAG: hypothetical protein WC797_03690, partial [Candidatus Paceibacterota bacterium]
QTKREYLKGGWPSIHDLYQIEFLGHMEEFPEEVKRALHDRYELDIKIPGWQNRLLTDALDKYCSDKYGISFSGDKDGLKKKLLETYLQKLYPSTGTEFDDVYFLEKAKLFPDIKNLYEQVKQSLESGQLPSGKNVLVVFESVSRLYTYNHPGKRYPHSFEEWARALITKYLAQNGPRTNEDAKTIPNIGSKIQG